jgi:ketosteroid isomerase-like protein
VEAPVLAVEARAVRDVVALALNLDLEHSPAADTLYDEAARVVSNGRERAGPPRFAAVGRGGIVTMLSLHVEVVPGGLAWAFADYRWTGADGTAAEFGTATVLLKQRTSGWKIAHAHSSQPLPWQ